MDAASRVKPMLYEVTCQEQGLLGTRARAAPQEAGAQTVADEEKEGAGEQRVKRNLCRQSGKLNDQTGGFRGMGRVREYHLP